jgi:MFS family permease
MSLAATRMKPWQRPGRLLLMVVIGFGLATIGFGLSKNFALSLFCLSLVGATDTVSVIIRMTLEQTITPDALRGRVSSINFLFVGFSNELGSFESGAAAALFGPVAAVVGGGIASILIVGLVATLWPQLARIGPLHTLSPERPMGDTTAIDNRQLPISN